jgi:transcriptional regulator with GAF, ATPase, and Fis domain
MTTEPRAALTEEQIIEALERHDCRKDAAARELGVTRQGLHWAMQRFGLYIEVSKVVRRSSSSAT